MQHEPAGWLRRQRRRGLSRDRPEGPVGRRSDGQPIYIGGVRGVLERNTMRYYLGVETVLAAAEPLPASLRLSQSSQSLRDWFVATERYPLQLHEIDSDTYLQMKLRQLHRQETEPPPAAAN
jgi:hypothetical protein